MRGQWRVENAWCDGCGVYDCRRHSLGNAVLTAALSGGLFGTVVALYATLALR